MTRCYGCGQFAGNDAARIGLLDTLVLRMPPEELRAFENVQDGSVVGEATGDFEALLVMRPHNPGPYPLCDRCGRYYKATGMLLRGWRWRFM